LYKTECTSHAWLWGGGKIQKMSKYLERIEKAFLKWVGWFFTGRSHCEREY
jgi:hypothetical protein